MSDRRFLSLGPIVFLAVAFLTALGCQSESPHPQAANPPGQSHESAAVNNAMTPLITRTANASNVEDRTAIVLTASDAPVGDLPTVIHAIDQAIRITADNMANAQTIGFKARRALFTGSAAAPTVRRDLTQGDLIQTGEPLDLAIDGEGYFYISFDHGGEQRFGYVRTGNFSINADGAIVLNNGEEASLEPMISITVETTSIDISSSGRVYAKLPGAIELQELGQIQLARFVNPHGLEAIRNGVIYLETQASGPPMITNPEQDGSGSIQQAHLEQSNVRIIDETTRLMTLTSWREHLVQAIAHRPTPMPTVSTAFKGRVAMDE